MRKASNSIAVAAAAAAPPHTTKNNGTSPPHHAQRSNDAPPHPLWGDTFVFFTSLGRFPHVLFHACIRGKVALATRNNSHPLTSARLKPSACASTVDRLGGGFWYRIIFSHCHCPSPPGRLSVVWVLRTACEWALACAPQAKRVGCRNAVGPGETLVRGSMTSGPSR